MTAVGSGDPGGRAGAAIRHYSLSFQKLSLFLGGKEDMWAVRALGMEACGRCEGRARRGGRKGAVLGRCGCMKGVDGR